MGGFLRVFTDYLGWAICWWRGLPTGGGGVCGAEKTFYYLQSKVNYKIRGPMPMRYKLIINQLNINKRFRRGLYEHSRSRLIAKPGPSPPKIMILQSLDLVFKVNGCTFAVLKLSSSWPIIAQPKKM
jgi:hypothetical protein